MTQEAGEERHEPWLGCPGVITEMFFISSYFEHLNDDLCGLLYSTFIGFH